MRAVTREVRDLDRDVTRLLEPFEGAFNPSADPAIACALLVDHLCMRRNKRCLLAYHRVRTEKLEELCWTGVDLLEQQQPSEGGSQQTALGSSGHSSLSPEEEEYFRQYGDLLAAYKGQWTDVDLTGTLEPPKDLFIDVRVLKDAGEIQTEYGYVSGSFVFFSLEREEFVCLTVLQSDQFDQEQSTLCPTGRCGAVDCPGFSGTIELNMGTGLDLSFGIRRMNWRRLTTCTVVLRRTM